MFSEERPFPPGFFVRALSSPPPRPTPLPLFHFRLWMLRSVKFPPLSFDTAVHVARSPNPRKAAAAALRLLLHNLSGIFGRATRFVAASAPTPRSAGGRFVTSCCRPSWGARARSRVSAALSGIYIHRATTFIDPLPSGIARKITQVVRRKDFPEDFRTWLTITTLSLLHLSPVIIKVRESACRVTCPCSLSL